MTNARAYTPIRPDPHVQSIVVLDRGDGMDMFVMTLVGGCQTHGSFYKPSVCDEFARRVFGEGNYSVAEG